MATQHDSSSFPPPQATTDGRETSSAKSGRRSNQRLKGIGELTKAEQLEICQLYIKKKDSVREIARAYGAHPTTLYRVLHAYEIELHGERVSRKKKVKRRVKPDTVSGNPVGYEAAMPQVVRSSAPTRRSLMQRIRDFFKG